MCVYVCVYSDTLQAKTYSIVTLLHKIKMGKFKGEEDREGNELGGTVNLDLRLR